MNRSLSLALILIVFTPCFGITPEEIAENAIPSVVKIITYDITGAQKGQGSGFFVTPRKIITNEHVVEGAYSAAVFIDERCYDLVTILKTEVDMDLAIISVNADNEAPRKINPDAELKPGQRVLAIGNPLGLEKTL
jgi:S1-C subfamily serine protease